MCCSTGLNAHRICIKLSYVEACTHIANPLFVHYTSSTLVRFVVPSPSTTPGTVPRCHGHARPPITRTPLPGHNVSVLETYTLKELPFEGTCSLNNHRLIFRAYFIWYRACKERWRRRRWEIYGIEAAALDFRHGPLESEAEGERTKTPQEAPYRCCDESTCGGC